MLEQFVHTKVRVIFQRRSLVYTMYAKVEDSKTQGYKFNVSGTNTLDVSDETSHSLGACADQEYEEHKGKSHLAKTSMRNMFMA